MIDRKSRQYLSVHNEWTKKQPPNCGLSGRASGGPLFYPIAQLRHVDLLCNLSLPLYIYILLFLCAISHMVAELVSDRERFSKDKDGDKMCGKRYVDEVRQGILE